MWSLILYLLFGIGQPANTQFRSDVAIIQTTEVDGDTGGETGTPRPPKGK
ncbi:MULTISPECIES: hypothetical protein [Sphingobacterium]|uniref:Uncharacterized protein n=1 Tax=Sphingobacterium zeae TaxID=1776859 RepID=A0ABU0UAS0_9SPHI|nr:MULTISPECIES: hypothetical protein [Sphingobacterium]MDQ1151933.1 hypothetical protein [Sphingobacterium zeae]MDR6734979.1 hypothetical protein [Sphingobacterium sp. 2149]